MVSTEHTDSASQEARTEVQHAVDALNEALRKLGAQPSAAAAHPIAAAAPLSAAAAPPSESASQWSCVWNMGGFDVCMRKQQ